MRFQVTLAALAAAGAYAMPQDVQPISQISDGQIQAPPATSAAAGYSSAVGSVVESASVPAATEVLPSVSAVPTAAPTVATTPLVNPSAPAPTASAPVVSAPSNGTVSSSALNGTVSTGSPTGSASGSGTAPPENTGAASTNMVSIGGLALAVFAFLA